MNAASGITDSVSRWLRPELLAASAYHVPDASGCIKLDAMENPYPLPEALHQAWLTALAHAPLHRYPDPQGTLLKQQLRTTFALPDTAELLLGNGSDELILLLCLALAGQGRCVLAPEPGFVMYRILALACQMAYIGVPLRAADFSLDPTAMLQAIQTHQPALIFLAYPNNPTGNLFAPEVLREILAHAPGLVVIDEAYEPFAESSTMDWLAQYPNLLLLRTLSKFGLAGLRLGYLVGAPAWLTQIDKLRLPYNINVLTQLSGQFLLQHADHFLAQAAQLRTARTSLSADLAALPGLCVYPSRANFILFRTPRGLADALFRRLRAQQILIKNLSPAGGLLQDCLRVTVGTPAENQAFLSACRTGLASLVKPG
jgi:histidinol-phosphate aminotransferase